MKIKIITPDHVIFEGDADSVILPGINGEFHIMKNHAAIVSALVGGKIKLYAQEIPQKYQKNFETEHAAQPAYVYFCQGGVVEFSDNNAIILCE